MLKDRRKIDMVNMMSMLNKNDIENVNAAKPDR